MENNNSWRSQILEPPHTIIERQKGSAPCCWAQPQTTEKDSRLIPWELTLERCSSLRAASDERMQITLRTLIRDRECCETKCMKPLSKECKLWPLLQDSRNRWDEDETSPMGVVHDAGAWWAATRRRGKPWIVPKQPQKRCWRMGCRHQPALCRDWVQMGDSLNSESRSAENAISCNASCLCLQV